MSTSAKTLIAAPVIYNELKDAEEKAIEDVADTLQMLPVQQETEIGKEAAQHD